MPIAATCVLCWVSATSPARAEDGEANGVQRFLASHAASLNRYCNDAVVAGEVFTMAISDGNATAVKVGGKLVGWLGCQKMLSAATQGAQRAIAEASFRASPSQIRSLAEIRGVEDLPVEIEPVPVSPQEANAINALHSWEVMHRLFLMRDVPLVRPNPTQ